MAAARPKMVGLGEGWRGRVRGGKRRRAKARARSE